MEGPEPGFVSRRAILFGPMKSHARRALRGGVGRARGRRVCGECAGCLWARERYAMSALRRFITSKAKLKKKEVDRLGARGQK